MPQATSLFSLRSLGCRLLLILANGIAYAADPLVLQSPQIKALGIESAIIEASQAGQGRLPAKVLVPNEQMRVVAAPVAGMIAQLAVAPGMNIRRGQVLARLASPQALELQRDALQSSSQAKLMQQNLNRDEALFAEGLIAESRLQTTRAAAAQANAAAEQGRQSLALAGITGGRLGGELTLTAPLDGVVLEQNAQLGQRVESATPIYTVARLAPLWLEIQAPAALAPELHEGSLLRVAGSETRARLIAIGRAIDPASQTVLLRAEVGKGVENLRPGQLCEVSLDGNSRQARKLPSSALARIDGQNLVFVESQGEGQSLRYTPRPVRIIAQGGNSLSVEGLKPGERIAIKGVSALKAMATGVGRE